MLLQHIFQVLDMIEFVYQQTPEPEKRYRLLAILKSGHPEHLALLFPDLSSVVNVQQLQKAATGQSSHINLWAQTFCFAVYLPTSVWISPVKVYLASEQHSGTDCVHKLMSTRKLDTSTASADFVYWGKSSATTTMSSTEITSERQHDEIAILKVEQTWQSYVESALKSFNLRIFLIPSHAEILHGIPWAVLDRNGVCTQSQAISGVQYDFPRSFVSTNVLSIFVVSPTIHLTDVSVKDHP